MIMTTSEKVKKCIDYNKTFTGLTKALKTAIILDEILMPLPIPSILKPMYLPKVAIVKISAWKIDEYQRFEKKCIEDDKKMEEIKKTAIPID